MSVDHTASQDVWFITGASRGLGYNLVQEALRAGKRVVAGCRNVSSSSMMNALSEQYGGQKQLLIVRLDVTSAEQINEAVQSSLKHFGTIDVLVNNAGYSDIASIEETSLKEFRIQMETNLFGVIACTKAILPLMRRNKKGRIFQISSVAGQLGPPGRGPYAAAKWGLEGFSEVLNAEVRSFGVFVTIFEPGGFRTDFATSSSSTTSPATVMEDYKSTVEKMINFQALYSGKQPGDPRKAAKAMLLISELPNPPLRVALGTDAYNAIEHKQRQRIEEAQAYKSLSLSMSFQDDGDSDLSSAWKEVLTSDAK